MNPTWTPSATQTLERFLNDVRRRSTRPGVDADEVSTDFRRHVEEEMAHSGLRVVTDADLQRLLARLDSTPPDPEPPETPRPAPKPDDRPKLALLRPGPGAALAVVLFGVVLPLITCLIEAVGQWCATELFDPWPTPIHFVLAFLVPVFNGLAWLRLRGHWGKEDAVPRWMCEMSPSFRSQITHLSLIRITSVIQENKNPAYFAASRVWKKSSSSLTCLPPGYPNSFRGFALYATWIDQG